MTNKFGYELLGTDGKARRGRVTTAHGTFETPAFMAVGTAATVKGMMPSSVAETGTQVVLGNTYHLMLRPTAERVAKFGGLHKFMNWPGPILTDSGGFQVYSLTSLRKMDENGVEFQSHIDGSKHFLSPERSMEIQNLLDSDITMAFDECTPYPCTKEEAAESMRLSMRWALRCKEAYQERDGYGLFGIVQGSVHEDLREESATALKKLDFEGYAVGGLAVGEGQDEMLKVLDFTNPHLPTDKPRYLMGVGTPSDLVESVARGIDMFDCVMPTRSGRTNKAFTRRGAINMKNARHRDDDRPMDEACSCPACTQFSRGYIYHLIKCNEILAPMLITWHNLQYYQDLMKDMRDAIAAGTFERFRKGFHEGQQLGDVDPL